MAGPIRIAILADGSRARRELEGVSRSASKVGSGFAKLRLPAIAALGGLALGARAAVRDASDLAEVVSKVGQIFGPQARDIEAFAAAAEQSLGQSKTAALDAASTFGLIGQKAGLSGTETAKFAKRFTGLASDLASFNNTTPEEAVEAIGAAMRGESEPIRKYGVLLDDATLRARALKLGLIDNVKKGLTPQQKALAASQEILAQTGKAQGDFARTSGGAANQARILAAQQKNLSAELGARLLPVWIKLQTALIAGLRFIGPHLSRFADNAARAGSALGAKLGPVVAAVVPVLQRFAGWIANVVVPALQKLASGVAAGASAAFDKIRNAVQQNEPQLRALGSAIASVVSFLVSKLGPILGWLARVGFPLAGAAIAHVVGAIAGLVRTAQTIHGWAKSIGAAATAVVGWFKALPGRVQTALGNTVKTLYQKGRGFVVGLLQGAQSFGGSVTGWLGRVRSMATNAIRDTGRTLYSKGRGLLIGFLQGVQSFWGSVTGWLARIRTMASNALGNVGRTLYQKGRGLMLGFLQGIQSFFSFLARGVRVLRDMIAPWLGDLGGILRGAGQRLIQGLIDGIKSKAGDLASAVTGLAGIVARNFPGSPIKAGPLKSWNNGGAGRRLIALMNLGLIREARKLEQTINRISADIEGGLSPRPSVALAAAGGTLLPARAVGASAAPVVINVYALTATPEVGRKVKEAIVAYERDNGDSWRR